GDPPPLDAVQCFYGSDTVTPPPYGSVSTTLTLQAPLDAPFGNYDYGIQVSSPGAQQKMEWPFNVAVPGPSPSASCPTGITLTAGRQEWTPVICQISVGLGFGDVLVVYPDYDGSVETQVASDRVSMGSAGGGTRDLQVIIRPRPGMVGLACIELPAAKCQRSYLLDRRQLLLPGSSSTAGFRPMTLDPIEEPAS
ncbi:MAG: hypothetical protein WD627_02795, partial [Actinomycetota bacterium]